MSTAEPRMAFPAPTATVALVNGRVITVNARDELAEAVSLAGKRILRVGSRDYVEQTIGRDTRVIDLRGRAVIPGMTENHIHITNAPRRHWVNVNIDLCPSIEGIAERIAAAAQTVPAGEWVFARGFQTPRLRERRNPDRHDLDPVSHGHPVGIQNRESMGWTFNTLGLRRIGVQDDTPDPPGGPWSGTSRGVLSAPCGTTAARSSSTRTYLRPRRRS